MYLGFRLNLNPPLRSLIDVANSPVKAASCSHEGTFRKTDDEVSHEDDLTRSPSSSHLHQQVEHRSQSITNTGKSSPVNSFELIQVLF